MPVRAFVSQSIEQLQVTLGQLERALASGNIEELRVAGVMTRMGRFRPEEVQLRYNQCRYELHLRACALPCSDPNRVPYLKLYTNPWTEKGMKVHSRSSVGVFGYPLPAPIVPPEP